MTALTAALAPMLHEPSTGAATSNPGVPIVAIAVLVLVVVAVVFFIRRRQ